MRSALCAVLLLPAGARRQGEDSDDEFNLARNLFRDAGDYATAAELFADFIRNRPDSRHLADARLMLARSYARSDRCGEAIGAYEEFYLEHPDHLSTAEARRERAACLRSEGDHAGAARAYAAGLALDPDYGKAEENLSRIVALDIDLGGEGPDLDALAGEYAATLKAEPVPAAETEAEVASLDPIF